MTLKDPKVIIVGGSVAGLSLALMLERNGIDFVVLEGYPDIAPQVGASIGIVPNGLRILDQLGCSDQVIAAAEYPVKKVEFRDSKGKAFWSFGKFGQYMEERHGYPVVFLDRCTLIQILYDHIKQKDRVLTSEPVVSIENHSSHVSVTTKAGKTFTGSILVGGDGIHSTVREKMWEEANKSDPTWFDPAEKEALPVTWSCIFGISEGVQIEKGTMSSVFNEHFSYLIPSGPRDKTYWFLVNNIGKKVYGSDIPRYTKEEELALVKQHWDDVITPTVRFSDLYKNKTNSVYTTLPEYVYKKWYYKRTITIGDAAHKLEPLTGQGGNSAIETAAALTNNIVAAMKLCPLQEISTEDVTSLLENTQSQREERMQSLLKAAHKRQRLDCMESPLLKFIANFVFPFVPEKTITSAWIPTYAPGTSLNMIPIPNKPRTIPYYDELLRAPSSRGKIGYLLYAVFLAMAFIGYKMLFVAGRVNGTFGLVAQAIQNGLIKDSGIDMELRQSYTGIESIDKILRTLVTIFIPAISNNVNPEQPFQLLYFLLTALPLIAIFTVEGYRQRNQWTLISSAGFWGILYQLRGIGCIAPLYFAASLFVSRNQTFFIDTGRTVPAAKFILPALVMGYLIPTILLFLTWGSSDTLQVVIALWQPAPLVVSILTTVLSMAARIIFPSATQQKDTPVDTESDLPHLRTLYQVTGTIAVCAHTGLMFAGALSSEISLTRLLFPTDSFAPGKTLSKGVFVFFQNDLLLVTAGCFLWCLTSLWDLHRSGLPSFDMSICFLGLIAAYVIVGPGATVAAVWFWREEAMSHKPGHLCK
ncbi:hypothetical protein N7488_009285 [Penicillium malachiteum]|nr:hypothetical protein N7488_009285 [Penicillium malachiteum]